MSNWLAYIAFRSVETVARLLPVSLAWRLGAYLGWLSMWLSGKYRRLVIRNLTIAFGGEMSPQEIRSVARRHMMHLGGNFLAGMKMPFMSPEKIRAHMETEGVEQVAAALKSGKGVIYSLLHMGNWEILSQRNVLNPGYPGGGIFQPLHNKYLNAHVKRSRERTGTRMFDRKDGFHGPVKFVREVAGLGILSDQRAGEKGVWCPFFGRLASTTTLPLLMARRAGAPVFPVGVITLAPGRWKVVVGEPVPPLSADLSVEEGTALLNERLEKIIRRSPADWFWVHNRWRTPRGEILLANAKRGIALAPGGRVEDLQPFEIVIRAPDTLSESCHALPAVRALRRGRPDARITVLTRAGNEAFWKMDTEVDEVLPVPDGASAAAVLKATGRYYDAGVLFDDSKQAARDLAGAGRLIGYEGEGRKRLLHQIIPPRKNPGPVVHRTRDYLRIALHCGANVDDPTLHDRLPGPDWTPGGYVGLCPGGAFGPSQRWPVESWAEAAKLVAARTGAQFAVFGTEEEKDVGARLTELLGSGCRDFTGKTTLEQLARILCQCRAVVAHDSGSAHFAASLGVPVIAIFGPTESAQSAPRGPLHATVRRHVECSPCFLANCPMDHRCMRELTPERVAETVAGVISQPVPVI